MKELDDFIGGLVMEQGADAGGVFLVLVNPMKSGKVGKVYLKLRTKV